MTQLVSLPDHKVIRALESNEALTHKVKEVISAPTEFFQVTVGNGVKLDGWMIKPPDFDPTKKVSGAGLRLRRAGRCDGYRHVGRLASGCFTRLSHVRDTWSSASTIKGRRLPRDASGERLCMADVGVLSSVQQASAIQELAKERVYVDSSRLAIWGWSGGGSNTLNMMFRYPGLFKAGIAVAPVADQRHYDTIYQERYMGLPEQNPKGYHDGSPISFADGLNAKLLVIHGSGDDNVHFQGTELLINRLVELGKPFDMMDYPNRTHSISEGAGTSYHIHSLIVRYLEENVPAGGVGQ